MKFLEVKLAENKMKLIGEKKYFLKAQQIITNSWLISIRLVNI